MPHVALTGRVRRLDRREFKSLRGELERTIADKRVGHGDLQVHISYLPAHCEYLRFRRVAATALQFLQFLFARRSASSALYVSRPFPFSPFLFPFPLAPCPSSLSPCPPPSAPPPS